MSSCKATNANHIGPCDMPDPIRGFVSTLGSEFYEEKRMNISAVEKAKRWPYIVARVSKQVPEFGKPWEYVNAFEKATDASNFARRKAKEDTEHTYLVMVAATSYAAIDVEETRILDA